MSNRLNLAIVGLIAVIVVAWVGFAVYAEKGGGEGGMAEDEHAEHTQMLAKPKEASNAQARLAVTLNPQEGIGVGEAGKFSARAVAPDGTLNWQFAPHDGIPYEVRVAAAPTGQSSAQFPALNVAPVVI